MDKSFPVTRPTMPPYEEYCAEIRDLWDSRWLTNTGTKHRQLQTELTHYLSVEQVELLTNGHMALELSLQALGLNGEVLTTPFTFVSTTQAIVRSGMTPVFCDVDPVFYTLDPAKLEERITPRTCAILPVHVYGTPCEVETIEDIAKRYGLAVLYDAAHAFGVTYKGRGIASYGDVSCFSFHATKVFHTIEGGAACFRDKGFGRRLSLLKNFGLEGEDAVEQGANAKFNEFCAAMGLCNLRYIDGEIEKRKQVVQRYRANLKDVPGLRLLPERENAVSNYAYFPVLFEEAFGADRDMVSDTLRAAQVMARKYFYPLTSVYTCFHGVYDPKETPIALEISRRVLTLPLYADLSLEAADRICEIVLTCQNHGRRKTT